MSVYHKRPASVRYPISERDGIPGRVCRDCNAWKPLSEFYRISGRRHQDQREYLTRCKPCHIAVCAKTRRNRDKDLAWHQRNKERRNLRNKALRYRVPESELVEMLAAGCKICAGFDRLHIDHDHRSNITRGVLCRACNHGLGNFADDPERLRAALDYLKAAELLQPRPDLPRLPPGRRRHRLRRCNRDARMSDRILTLRQPWATAVIRYGKNVENREWTTDYRGRLWIHAGLKGADLLGPYLAAASVAGVDHNDVRPLLAQLDRDRGHVIGHVDLIDIVTNSDSPWAERDAYHWLLANPVPLATPVPRRGHMGLGHFTLGET